MALAPNYGPAPTPDFAPAPKPKRGRKHRRRHRHGSGRRNRDLSLQMDSNATYQREPSFTDIGASGVNNVSSGAGSQRKGQSYRTMRDSSGAYYHVYGRGRKARKVRLRSSVAKAYGYGQDRASNATGTSRPNAY